MSNGIEGTANRMWYMELLTDMSHSDDVTEYLISREILVCCYFSCFSDRMQITKNLS